MGTATTIIGLLPSYEQAGLLAPLALVVLRFAQGLAVGGQWGGAALMAIESAPSGRRGFYGSFVQMAPNANLLSGRSVPGKVNNGSSHIISATHPCIAAAHVHWQWRRQRQQQQQPTYS